MKRYRLIWFNYIAQEDWADTILAKDEKDAYEIAIMYIKSVVGHDDDFAEKCLESLNEELDHVITREEVEEELRKNKWRY